MDAKNLTKIVTNLNERTERETVREAERLIEQIVRNQKAIKEIEESTAKLRVQLKELEVEQLDPVNILGV